MKAIFVVPGPEGGVFEYREISVPSPAAGELLIAIRAAGTNRGELIQRPLLRSSNPALRPLPAGIEFAGEIAALGDSVAAWRIGERVMGRGLGCYAEFTVVNERALMRMPDGMEFAGAAATVGAGESVMVTAGPSGVGTAALQIARLLRPTR